MITFPEAPYNPGQLDFPGPVRNHGLSSMGLPKLARVKRGARIFFLESPSGQDYIPSCLLSRQSGAVSVVSQFEISALGGERTSGYWSHRQCDTQIVSDLTVRRRLKLF
jgi:hypothetical protein